METRKKGIGVISIPKIKLPIVTKGQAMKRMKQQMVQQFKQPRFISALIVSSDAFSQGGQIPRIYTCDGKDISPPLSWGSVPKGTASIAILVADPDAPGGTYIHWVVYNIPPSTRGVTPGKNILPAGSIQGINGMGRLGYMGPCPPKGRPHHYHFMIYALDSIINLTGKRDGRNLTRALTGHILAKGELVGIYKRA